nr:DUF1003 domain-containing protein [Pengzhenrongella sicca]
MAERLDTPKESRRSWVPRLRRDPDAVGRIAEAFARFMGTGRFLMYMSGFVVVWVTINSLALWGLGWDPYPFILLNLFFSVQASYAAPLILLAQNRQADRDRVAIEQDRQQAERNLADTEYLAREMAGLRIALGEVATRDFLRSELRNLLEELTPDGDGDDAGPHRREDRGRRDGRGRKDDRARRGDRARKDERKKAGAAAVEATAAIETALATDAVTAPPAADPPAIDPPATERPVADPPATDPAAPPVPPTPTTPAAAAVADGPDS